MVVALIGDDATLKRFYPEGNMVRLQPANPTMQPIRVPGAGRARPGRGRRPDAEVLTRRPACCVRPLPGCPGLGRRRRPRRRSWSGSGTLRTGRGPRSPGCAGWPDAVPRPRGAAAPRGPAPARRVPRRPAARLRPAARSSAAPSSSASAGRPCRHPLRRDPLLRRSMARDHRPARGRPGGRPGQPRQPHRRHHPLPPGDRRQRLPHRLRRRARHEAEAPGAGGGRCRCPSAWTR